MKTILFIIGFILAVLFSYGQTVEMRAVTHEGEKTTYEPTLQIPIYDLYQSVIENGKRVQTHTEISPIQSAEQGDIWFYPETFSYSDSRNGEFRQGWISKSTLKRVEQIDVKMNIGIIKVNRIYEGQEVLENRIVSHYILVFYYNDGTMFQLGDKTTPCNIISNNEIHVPYPDIVPGSKFLFKAAIDDNGNLGTGETFSVDGGLKIDYD